MKKFRELLEEEMKNPAFKKEWDALDVEFSLIRRSLDLKLNKYYLCRRVSRFIKRKSLADYSFS